MSDLARSLGRRKRRVLRILLLDVDFKGFPRFDIFFLKGWQKSIPILVLHVGVVHQFPVMTEQESIDRENGRAK